MLANHHTHCEFCDGKTSARNMARAASESGFKVLGFSSHAPLPFSTAWTMDTARLPGYAAEIRELGKRYAPGMEILLGLEVDFIEGMCGPADGRFDGVGLDYRIGSVHHVAPPALGENPLSTVDGQQHGFDALIARGYGGDGLALARDYYRTLALCIDAGGFDIVGHFDLIRKNNPGQSRFREDTPAYREAAMMAVDRLKGDEFIVEINTGGMARGKTDSPYPASWILRELRARGVPVCVNADAHETRHLLACREAGLAAAREAGYGELTVIAAGGRKRVPLE